MNPRYQYPDSVGASRPQRAKNDALESQNPILATMCVWLFLLASVRPCVLRAAL